MHILSILLHHYQYKLCILHRILHKLYFNPSTNQDYMLNIGWRSYQYILSKLNHMFYKRDLLHRQHLHIDFLCMSKHMFSNYQDYLRSSHSYILYTEYSVSRHIICIQHHINYKLDLLHLHYDRQHLPTDSKCTMKYTSSHQPVYLYNSLCYICCTLLLSDQSKFYNCHHTYGILYHHASNSRLHKFYTTWLNHPCMFYTTDRRVYNADLLHHVHYPIDHQDIQQDMYPLFLIN